MSRGASLAILSVLASLLVLGIASASSAAGAETRVWAFDLAENVHVAGRDALTRGQHLGCELAEYDSASGSLLAAREVDAALDATGKVHGKLPDVKDLGRYGVDDLKQLRDELKQSVQERIRKNSELGPHKPHGQRQAAEQTLIKSIAST